MQISKDSKNQIQISKDSKNQIDIHERIYSFVLNVINLTKKLPKNPQNLVVCNQLLRSVTSVGANDQEADAAESRRDFIAKLTISKKELIETSYWLRILFDTNQSIKNDITILRNESEQLLKIVSKIIINTKYKV